MIASVGLAGLAFDPVPEALGASGIEKNEKVFDVLLGDVLLDGSARLRVRDAVAYGDFEGNHPSQLGDRGASVRRFLCLGLDRTAGLGVRPAQLVNKQARELEFLEAVASAGDVEGHGSGVLDAERADNARLAGFGVV